MMENKLKIKRLLKTNLYVSLICVQFLYFTCAAQIDGQIDSTFGINGFAYSAFSYGGNGIDFAIDNQNNIYTIGKVDGNNPDFGVIKFNSMGAIDTSFATQGMFIYDFGFDDYCKSIAIQNDSLLLIAGYSYTWDGFNVNSVYNQFSIIRLNLNGELDSTFGVNGVYELNFDPNDCSAVKILVETNGKVLVVGNYSNSNSNMFFAIRLTQNGNIDLTYGNNGIFQIQLDSIYKYDVVTCAVMQPDGKLLIGGQTSNALFQGKVFGLIRLNEIGTIDSSFGDFGIVKTNLPFSGNDYAYGIALQSDGKILMCGSAYNDKLFAICRYNIFGNLDLTFATNGIFTLDLTQYDDYLSSLIVQQDGKIVACGKSYTKGCIIRVLASGQIDSTFNLNGINTIVTNGESSLFSLAQFQSDGIISCGYAKDTSQTYQFSLVSLKSILFSGIDQNVRKMKHLNVYPNPTNDVLQINYTISSNSNIIIQIFNSLGQIVMEESNQQTFGTYTSIVDTKNYANGIYYIRFSDGINSKQAKVIIE